MKGPLEILKINYVIYRKFLGKKKYCNIHEKIWKKRGNFLEKKEEIFWKKMRLTIVVRKIRTQKQLKDWLFQDTLNN